MVIPEHLKDSPGLQFVVSQGWNWRGGDGGQIEIEKCPFCRKGDYKLYMAVMNPQEGTRDGLYFCHHGGCNATGNLRTLKEKLGLIIPGVESRKEWAESGKAKTPDALPDAVACHAALLGDPETLDYLINVRGFSQEIIDKQKLGIKEKVWFRKAGETKALVIPYLANGNTVYAKYRTIPPDEKDFVSPSGWEAPLYNEEIIKSGLKELLFVEGEADALSCLSNGINYVVGVPGANLRKAEWIDKLDQVEPEKIYILYDNDRPGQKGAQELATRIGIEKCLKIVLPPFEIEKDGNKVPGKDINEWFRAGHTLEEFEALKNNAQLFDVIGVASCTDALSNLEDELAGKEDLAPKYVTGWPSLNRLVGFEDGDVIDILAPEKVGKTTFGLNLIDHMVSSYGEDGIVICLEMTQLKLAKKWVAMVTGWQDKITTPGTEESKAQLESLKIACNTARQIMEGRVGDLYFAYPPIVKTPEDIFSLIRNCVRRYGVKWVMFDNIQLLCDNTLHNQGHRTIHLSQISKGFAKLAKDLQIKIIRILQPKRIEKGSMVSSNDTEGASHIAKDCDCTITLWRNPVGEMKQVAWDEDMTAGEEQAFEPKMKVSVALSRYSSGGWCKLFFDGERSQVREYTQSDILPGVSQNFNQIISQGTVPVNIPQDSTPTNVVPQEIPL